MNDSFVSKKCIPCARGTNPYTPAECEMLLKKLEQEGASGWMISDAKALEKEFRFKNYKEALSFVNRLSCLAEEEGHHPDLFLSWGRVKISLMTHKIKGLSESDFIMACKFDRLYGETSHA